MKHEESDINCSYLEGQNGANETESVLLHPYEGKQKESELNETSANKELLKDSSDIEVNDVETPTHCDVDYASMELFYGITDQPPIHITLICGLQHALLSLSVPLIVALMTAEVVCASKNDEIKAQILSSLLFMSGVTTIMMNLFGVRLPMCQGPFFDYVLPLMLLSSVEGSSFCAVGQDPGASFANITSNATELEEMVMSRILDNITSLQGSLMVAGTVHFLLGFTGLIGGLMRYVGPITIVPTLTLITIFLTSAVIKYVATSWPIAISTMAISFILSMYLAKYNLPVPVWTPSGGFRIVRYPLHQVFAILISVLFNWGLCAILTSAGVFTNDPKDIQYKARTDARLDIINTNPWFTFPYPGQYGPFGFSIPGVVSCLVATMISVLDSVGDYYACSRVCRVPPPPSHAVNRGVMIEGICSFLSGTIGCGCGPITLGGNVGAIGITKVASRHVFLVTGVIYILFGIFGKFTAAFITIPYPVVGGACLVMYGMFFGVTLSNLQVVSLTSSRNVAILGTSIFVGFMIPFWAQKKQEPFNTGSVHGDQYMKMLLSNPCLCGTILAFFLDNTVPGTRQERGIMSSHAEEEGRDAEADNNIYKEGYKVYMPLLLDRLSHLSIMKYIPFMPHTRPKHGPL